MRKKRGQISVFILIGVLVLLIAMAFFMLGIQSAEKKSEQSVKKTLIIQEDVATISKTLQSSLDSSFSKAITHFSQGNTDHRPVLEYNLLAKNRSYYYRSNTRHFSSQSMLDFIMRNATNDFISSIDHEFIESLGYTLTVPPTLKWGTVMNAESTGITIQNELPLAHEDGKYIFANLTSTADLSILNILTEVERFVGYVDATVPPLDLASYNPLVGSLQRICAEEELQEHADMLIHLNFSASFNRRSDFVVSFLIDQPTTLGCVDI